MAQTTPSTRGLKVPRRLDPAKYPRTLSIALRSLRASRGWTMSAVSRLTGVGLPELSRMEAGKLLTLSGPRILLLARAANESRPIVPLPWEPVDLGGWCVLLLELDAKGRGTPLPEPGLAA